MVRFEALVSFADPIQQSKPMKTISISFLFLVTFPFQLMAQDSSESVAKPNVAPSYFTYSPVLVEDTKAKHIVQPARQSNRKSEHSSRYSTAFQQPHLQVSRTPTTTPKLASAIKQTSRFQVVGEEINEVIPAPRVSPGEFGLPEQVVRPTPSNSNPTIENPPQPPQYGNNEFRPREVRQEETASGNDAPRLQEEYPPAQEEFSAEPERVTLDDIQMSRRVNSWEREPSIMQDTVDHFSPGGEPFAQRGIVGDPNFFGIDRRTCCDEWEGICNCGGLKNNPGHLGIPWLRSKDNCDSPTKLCGKHRNQRQARRGNSCGCQSCCK